MVASPGCDRSGVIIALGWVGPGCGHQRLGVVWLALHSGAGCAYCPHGGKSLLSRVVILYEAGLVTQGTLPWIHVGLFA